MGLFGFGKKKEEETKVPTCCCGSGGAAQESCCCGKTGSGGSGIKVLGAGCKSCHEQFEYAKAAVRTMGLDMEVEYITDMERVMSYGVMRVPAIVVDGKVVSMGKVLKADEVESCSTSWDTDGISIGAGNTVSSRL